MKIQKIITVMAIGALLLLSEDRLTESMKGTDNLSANNETAIIVETEFAEDIYASLEDVVSTDTVVQVTETETEESVQEEPHRAEAEKPVSEEPPRAETEESVQEELPRAETENTVSDVPPQIKVPAPVQHLIATSALKVMLETSETQEQNGLMLPTRYEFTQVDMSYFDDALFIGDSRTDGLNRYGGLGNADVFASTGMSIYKVWEEQVLIGEELVTLQQLLDENEYSKIYITLGINEIGYHQATSIEKLQETIEKLQESEPGTIVFLQSNLHVSKKKSRNDKIYNNEKINEYNARMALLADAVNLFYIDCNELFNEDNALKASLTYDGIHIYKKYYPDWVTWLCTKGIVK